MIITLKNLRGGIRWWRTRGWPLDMHNADYYDLYSQRSAVGTGPWWTATVNRLWAWQAIRSPKPPNTKAAIGARGQSHLTAVATRHAQIVAASSAEPSITDPSWGNVAPLFALASRIKPGKSPVLSCKMCHFLFPKLFVVMDNTATGLFEYEFYWRGMKEEWSRFAQKAADALNLLVGAIQNAQPIHPLYPYETKIMDLCHIGYNQR